MFFFLLRSCLLGSLSGFNKSAATSAKCFFLSEMNANRFQTLFCISLLWGYTLEESSFVLDKLVTLSVCICFFWSHLLCFVNFYGQNRWVSISQQRFCIEFSDHVNYLHWPTESCDWPVFHTLLCYWQWIMGIFLANEILLMSYRQGSKLTFLLGSTGAPNFKKLGAPQMFYEHPLNIKEQHICQLSGRAGNILPDD